MMRIQSRPGVRIPAGLVTGLLLFTMLLPSPAAAASPVVTTTVAALAYAENTTVAADSGLFLTDSDVGNMASATVTLTTNYRSTEDVLGFTNQGGITGTWTVGTGVLALTGSASTATYQAALRTVTYNNNIGSSTLARTVAFSVNDGTTTSNTATRQITITASNDAPTLTTTVASLAYFENGTTAIDPGITLTDDEPNLESGRVFVNGGFVAGQDVLGFVTQGTITGSFAGGILTLTGTATVAQWQAALRTVTYNNTSDAPNTGNRQLGFDVSDGTAASNVGFRTVTVTAVNDGPLGTGQTITIGENSTYAYTAADFGMYDFYDAGAHSLLAVKVTNPPTVGSLKLSGTAVTAGQFIPVASINAGLFVFTPAPDTISSFHAPWDFQVQDNGGTANGGIDLDPVSNQMSFNVTDGPVVTATVANLAYTVGATTILDAGITVTDSDSANLSSARVTMTTNYLSSEDVLAFVAQNGITATWTPATGVLALSGTATVANYQAALRSITYTNAVGASTAVRTVTFVASDGAANSNTASRQITITGVNAAPINAVPASQSMLLNQRLTFSAASGNRISIGDADAGANPVQVQLTATNGTASLTATTGLTFSAGDGTSDATMTFTGTMSNINNALAWAVFDPATSFAGSASLQIVTSDLGNTGTGGAKTDTDSISIGVRNLGSFSANLDVVTPSVRTAALPVGTGPYGVDSNPTTNRIYVANFNGNSVSVVDGATDTVIATIPVGAGPMGLAVNSVTNRIYVPNNGASASGTTVSVIDGATNTVIATIAGFTGPRYVAVNEATGRMYVSGNGGNTVKVIDGASNAVTATMTLPSAPTGVAVNPVTNRIYVTYGAAAAGRVAVYNGATNTLVATVTPGQTPWAVAVNANTNTVWVSNFGSNSISVIDGATNTVTATVPTANWPTGLKIDPTSNRVYVTEFLSDSMAVIDGASRTVVARLSTGAAGNGPTDLGLNPATGRIYVAGYATATVRVFQDGLSIDGTASFSSPTYTVAGSGTGLVTASDEFQFLYRPMTGDGRLTVRTASITNTAGGALAGVMMRDGLNANGLFVMTTNTASGGVGQKYRGTVSAVPTNVAVAGAPVPQYLRITRTGNVFTTEYSADGTTWTQAGTPQTIAMNTTIYVGLAVTSENAAALNTSTFDIPSNEAPANSVPGAQSMVQNQRLTFSAASGNRISISDSDAGPNAVQVQLTVTNGTLTLKGITGLAFSAGDGTSDAAMTFTGTVSAVNNALAWIVYDPTAGYAGSAALQILTSDLGNTGSGGTRTDTDGVTIGVRNLGIFNANLDVITPSVRTAAVAVGTNPYGVDVNTTTNRVYVANNVGNSVSVIDGATDAVIATIPVGPYPKGLAVNSVTNRIYVPHNGATSNGTTVSVIDGGTNALVAVIPGFLGPRYVAVNQATNTVYVTNGGSTTVSVVNGATDAITGTIAVAGLPTGIDVNAVTNRIYVAYGSYGAFPGNLAVYNGATNSLIATIPVGQTPWSVAVNANTNTVYVSNFFASNTVSVIDGATNTVAATVPTLAYPTDVAVDPVSNRVYVTEWGADSMAVLDGATRTVIARLATGSPGNGPIDLGVNPATGRVYVASHPTSTVRVFQDGLSIAGTSSFSSPTYTVAGSGTGMVSTSDQFQFLYRSMTGNGRLTVRTASITNTAAGATAGVMMRDGLAADARFVMTGNTGSGSNSVRQVSRSTVAAVPTTVTIAGAAVPEYIRITRVGNVFTTEHSADGTTWTAAGTPQTITMGATIYVGLAVTSENATALNTSTFDTFGQNLAPVAIADPSYSLTEDGTLTQPAAGGVLTNDSDPEAGVLTAVIVSGTSGLTLNANGGFSYVAPPDFNGIATFTYRANDGVLDSNTVTATITVASANDVPSFTRGADQAAFDDAGPQSISPWATAITRGPANESGQVVDFIVTNNANALFSAQPAISATGTLTFTAAAGVSGVATVSVRIHDDGGTANGGVDTSAAQTFTITITIDDGAYVSSSGWATSFNGDRYLDLTFPAYVPAGSDVAGAAFRHSYRSTVGGSTTCYYFEVYSGATLLATHGSTVAPVSCNSSGAYVTDVISLPEVNSVAEANALTVRLYVNNSAGSRSSHAQATLGVDSSLDAPPL